MGIDEGKKLSIEHCKKVLNKNGGNYSDEQVKKISDILYLLGRLDYEIFKQVLKDSKKESKTENK